MRDQVVFLVLDEDFPGDLSELSRSRHLWVCNSKSNTPRIKEVWESGPKEYKEDSGVTGFDLNGGKTSTMYSTLEAIDEHHGGDPLIGLAPWSRIRVFGVKIQDVDERKVSQGLQVGKIELAEERDGFSIIRSSIGNGFQ